ncbi:hypothetical protein MTR67_031710 [Solanum verrucosum]|uniref:Uncharacterized protein n=1 Tax=Solanum verrucosum TaxID=315347 RepID=A0AAF0U2Z3_SOLVR|nr:hypothetical protein MTR67_031710 [Solanum verrucosum]
MRSEINIPKRNYGAEEVDEIVEDQNDEKQLYGLLHFVSKLSNCILNCFYGMLHFVFITKFMWYLAKFEFLGVTCIFFVGGIYFKVCICFLLYYIIGQCISSFTEFCMLF